MAQDVEDSKVNMGELAHSFLEGNRAAILITNLDGQIEYVNPMFTEVTGYTPDEVIGKNPRLLRGPDTPQSVYAEMWEALKAGQSWRGYLCNVRKNGERYWEYLRVMPVGAKGKITHYFAAADDVSEAQQRTLLLEQLANTSPDAFVVLDESANIVGWSRQGHQMFRQEEADVLGRHICELASPDVADSLRQQLLQYLSSAEYRFVTHRQRSRMVRKSGEVFPVEIWLSPGHYLDGIRFAGFIRDLTEVVRNEHLLVEAQKMEGIGIMAGGLSHDFRNLLSIIKANLQSVACTEGQNQQKFLGYAMDAIGKADEITSALMNFARPNPRVAKPVNLNESIRQLEPLIRQTAGRKIKVITTPAAEDAVAFINDNEFQNALINMVINARDAMPAGGELHIYTHNHHHVANTPPAASPYGSYIVVGVEDTGHGMPPDVAKRAFEPFYTTKHDKGTGLGLAMVYSFCRQAGGLAVLASQENAGTLLQLFIPPYILT